MIDWTEVIKTALSPATIGAIGLTYWKLRKLQFEMVKNQKRIEEKVNGNHKVTMRAIKAQGKLEGIVAGKRIAHEDLDHATRAIAKAAKRGQRRSTDKP
jgi:hypothetical protein